MARIELPEIVQVKKLAEDLKVSPAEVIGKLLSFGISANLNQDIDFDTAAIIADEFGWEATPLASFKPPLSPASNKGKVGDTKNLKPRPPVVSIMGHVDHGKTTLLDWLKKTKIAQSEAGGITQSLQAYLINFKNRPITLLDTPGHAAFEAIRKHGVVITDLVILIVAADEGIKPQTIEIINNCKSTDVPMIVAINKADKPGADIERVKSQLAEHGLIPEEWGGKTTVVPISALSGDGVDQLLEMIFLTLDLKELRANPDDLAEGVVIESHITPGFGPVATILIQNGTLKTGDFIVSEQVFGRIRTITDGRQKKVEALEPGFCGLISGLSGLPEFASRWQKVLSEKESRSLAKNFQRIQTVKSIKQLNIEHLDQSTERSGDKTLYKIIIKADTESSLKALKKSFEELGNDDVGIHTIYEDIGDVTESDLHRAKTAKAAIIGFNVKISNELKKIAATEKVKADTFQVIYQLVEYLENILINLMPVVKIDIEQAILEVLATFNPNKKNPIVGGIVKSGELKKGLIKVQRKNEIQANGEIVQIKRGREEIAKVAAGSECGLELKLSKILSPDFEKLEKGDQLINYFTQEQKKIYQKTKPTSF